MPFGIHKHSNRSKQALVSESAGSAQNEASSASLASSAASTTDGAGTNQAQFLNEQSTTDFISQSANPNIDQRSYQRSPDLLGRSQSTRHSNTPYSQQYLAAAVSSADDLSLDGRRHQQGQQIPAQVPVPTTEQKKSKSLFDRMRSSRAPEQKSQIPTQASYDNTTGLARRLSKKQENPYSTRPIQQRSPLDPQQGIGWQSAQESRLHLPSPREGIEELGPYLVPEYDTESSESVQGLGLQQTVRPVQGESDTPQNHISNGSERRYSPQSQYPPPNPINYDHPDPAHQVYQRSYNQTLLDTRPNSLYLDSQFRLQTTDTISQVSCDSPIEQREEPRPSSVQSNGPSPTNVYPQQRQEHQARRSSIQVQGSQPSTQQDQHATMAPPTGASQQNRRSVDPKGATQIAGGDSRDGPPPTYQQQFPRSQSSATGTSPLPSAGQQGSSFRGGPTQRDQFGGTAGGEQGRSTPPPATGDRDINDAYKELSQKYKKVKSLYFEKTSQVEQLQNTLANQRLSQSRTSLDDSEYMTRFQRLDGAAHNLAFNIRKDWRSIPPWLAPNVNHEAAKIGKQEMTGVGRACITRFLVEEIFNKTFHPGLETELSKNLKLMEQNIRRFSPTLSNQEESDALTAKVVQWRLATLEGLRDVLTSPESEEYKKHFIRFATTNLTANLLNFLADPAPPGIEDSAHMIVELAVSIACNMPLESRDISIVYPMPGDLVQPFIMKVETGIPALENPGADTSSEVDASSMGSGDKDETASKEDKTDSKTARKDKSKSGMLQAMMGGSSTSAAKKPAGEASDAKSKASTDDGTQKVRFAGFVGVEVRGRQILSKAPVWTIGS